MAKTVLDAEALRQHKGISFVGICTVFLLHDGEGHFFMAKRSKKARDEQGRWEIQGGGLKWGQTLEENLIREMKEESNATPKEIIFLGNREMFRELEDGTPTHWISFDYAVLVDRSKVKIAEPEMFDDSGWFSKERLPSPLHSQNRIFLDKYKDQLKDII